MSRQRLVTAALAAALSGFAVAASVFSIDWITCLQGQGGVVCREPRNAAAGSWTGLATTAMALVTNLLGDEP
jgi:hypothetical protein